MHRKLYELMEQQGLAKRAVVLTGENTGAWCLVREGACRAVTEEPDVAGQTGCAGWQDGTGQPDRTGQTDSFRLPSFDWNCCEREILDCQETKVITAAGEDIFVEILRKNPRLILLGAGHVSCPVAHIGKMLGFHVTVMDDREEFLSRERFPDADMLIQGSFEQLEEKIPAYENAYYVIVTRGHAGDAQCARQILKRPYAYLGMIGSGTKVRLTREKLLEEGFTQEQLDTVHAPIGLPIGGQLPEEIALSILAEIVQVKNAHYTAYCDEKVEAAVLGGHPGVLMTIVKKSGSSPRGLGSRMFVETQGKAWGSIGGGSVEFEAMGHAPQVKEPQVQAYDLSVSDAKKLGMVCGGRVEILFERIL